MVDNPQSPNGYPYVANDPANLTDSLGLSIWINCLVDANGNCAGPDVMPYGRIDGGAFYGNLQSLLAMGVIVNCPQCQLGQYVGMDNAIYSNETLPMLVCSEFGAGPNSRSCRIVNVPLPVGVVTAGQGLGGGPIVPKTNDAANNGTPQIPSKTQERLTRLKNCALGYYGIDPLSVEGLASDAKWGLIAAGAGGIPKAIPEALGIVRTIRPPGSSSFTSLFSILSAASGGGALRTVANFGSKWAGPIAIASAVIDATAIGICTASD